jgi:alpha-L-rhamnosidase
MTKIIINLRSRIMSETYFKSARPIWAAGMEKEMNITLGFRAVFDVRNLNKVELTVTGCSLYRVFVNGDFTAHGPARGPKGFFRVDQLDITDKLIIGENIITIEVVGYNINSFYLIEQSPFIQAEVILGGKVIASTAGEGSSFKAKLCKERIQKVQRYSFQRTFSEAYRLCPEDTLWRSTADSAFEAVDYIVLDEKRLIPRRLDYSLFSKRSPVKIIAKGSFESCEGAANLWSTGVSKRIGPKLSGYKDDELEVNPVEEIQKVKTVSIEDLDSFLYDELKIELEKENYHIVDFGINLTGFIGAKLICSEKTKLFLSFDEVLTEGEVDFTRLGCVNIISYELEKGIYDIESFEPYSLKYMKLMVFEGSCEISSLYIREYTNPDVYRARFASSDIRLNRLFEAGIETFRQNAVDVFMDCPSRERAGWLCDSFFTSRVAFNLSGNAVLEKNFFENFLLAEDFDFLPEGMLPMCYPSDSLFGNMGVHPIYAEFIPNWALWFVIELEEYLQRSGDIEIIEQLRPKIMQLFDYFKQFKNEYGLLEKLESWIMIEWSKANEFVQDVNYPTNMLYAGALAAAGRVYNIKEFTEEAEKIREAILIQAYDGSFFVDNAVRQNGVLKATDNKSEVCQYYAFFFNIANEETHKNLWKVLAEDFGPKRKATGKYPEVHMANAFIGNYLRLELLSRYGLSKQLLEESVDYLLYMVDRTGTLWENDGAYASCNHGFASHIVHILYRDALGIYSIDEKNKIIHLRINNFNFEWCEGRLPVGYDFITMKWYKKEEELYYSIELPEGYKLKVENLTVKSLVRI